jgi:hypothetical protein
MSTGSKPVATMGTPCRAATASYGRQPVTVQTWPAARNAFTRQPGASRMAAIAGGTSTWLTSWL